MNGIFIFGICISFVLLYLLITKKRPRCTPSLHKAITPESTIIAFDIHGVLFNPDWKKIGGLVWRNKKAWSLFIYLFNPRFVYDFFILLKHGAVPEAFIMHFAHQYPYFAQFKNLALAIANTQKPIASMINLLIALKSRGYTLHIFSNIGTVLYADLALTFPAIFCLFDAACVPSATTNYHGKRHKKTFLAYLEQFNPTHKQIIFIDNNARNIRTASRVGIVGIYYKNPTQLKRVFEELKVL